MRVAFITTDNRDHCRQYDLLFPYFGPAPEGILAGLANIPSLEIHVISCTQVQMSSPARLANNIYFHSLHVPKIGWLRTGYIGCILAVWRKLREIQPDILHAQGTERDCAISVALTSFPKVLTIHGNIRAIAKATKASLFSFWWFQAKLEAFVLPMFDGVFCNSAYTQSLVNTSAKQTWLVPNPLRKEFFVRTARLPIPAKPPTILVIGVISERKRQKEVLELLNRIRASGSVFYLKFIGFCPDSEYALSFKRSLIEPEQEGWASYSGVLSEIDLIHLMDASSALLHFPLEEAFGLVVAEALVRGLKLFAAKVGGIMDIAKGVQDAELFDTADWSSLEYSLRAWINNPTPSSSISRDLMESRYHPKVIAAKHLEIYRSVLNSSVRKNE